MAAQTTSRMLDKFMFRMPDGFRDRLAARARANRRSMNSEIVMIVEAAMDAADPKRSERPPGQAEAEHA